MKLTKSTDFALRVVVHLASQEQPVTMPQLSQKLRVPYHNLSKLVQVLSKAGVLQTRQGKNGGVLLQQSASHISLKTVIDIIDGPTRLSDCLSNKELCSLTHECRLRSVFSTIQSQIDLLFDGVKIADIVKEKELAQ